MEAKLEIRNPKPRSRAMSQLADHDPRKESTGAAPGIDRRTFFDAVAGTAALAAGVACSLPAEAAEGRSDAKTFREELRTPIVARHQVIVAGGGPSGVIAAAAAARSGADTLLVERYPFLGGNGMAGLMTCYNGFRNQRPPDALQTVKGIPADYIAELVRWAALPRWSRMTAPSTTLVPAICPTASASMPRRPRSPPSVCCAAKA